MHQASKFEKDQDKKNNRQALVNRVKKAGRALLENPRDDGALETLKEWRKHHIAPLNRVYKMLKRAADNSGNHAHYGQRLKSLNSILYKLKRFYTTGLKLSDMQDLGGCRVIFSKYENLRKVCEQLIKSSKITLKNKNDYITYPKKDGYRSVHLIYTHDKLKVEIQLRTQLQHAWATTVEIIDFFENQKLKLGEGDANWRHFFYLLADEFALLEGLPVHDNNIENRKDSIKKLADELKVVEKLKNYALVMQNLKSTLNSMRKLAQLEQDSDKKKHFKKIIKKYENAVCFVLIRRLKSKGGALSAVEIHSYLDIKKAQDDYLQLEKEYLFDDNNSVMLIKLASAEPTPIKQAMDMLLKGYPNFFSDSIKFLQGLEKILDAR